MGKKLSGLSQGARAIIGAAAIIHLILCNIHTSALLLLVNEICGFIMFGFVLLGLITLFESTQMKPGKPVPMLLTILFCFCTTCVGAMLNRIYNDAILHQPQLNTAVVGQAVTFTWALMIAFAIAGVMLALDLILRRKETSREE